MRKGVYCKVGIAVCIALLVLIVGSVGAMAYSDYVLTKSSTVTVIAESPHAQISLYSNDLCTTPTASIQWGSVARNDSRTLTLYIHNDGDVPVNVAITSTLMASYGSVVGSPVPVYVEPGECVRADVTLTLTGAVPLGTRSFVVRFTSSDAS